MVHKSHSLTAVDSLLKTHIICNTQRVWLYRTAGNFINPVP